MSSDVWVRTADGLVRGDWITRVQADGGKLKVEIAVPSGGDGAYGWSVKPDEIKVCFLEDLNDPGSAELRLVRLLAEARARDAASVIEVHDRTLKLALLRTSANAADD